MGEDVTLHVGIAGDPDEGDVGVQEFGTDFAPEMVEPQCFRAGRRVDRDDGSLGIAKDN